MRILSGTATCSAAPARTSTRGRSRASGRAPGTTSSSSARSREPERFDLGGAQVVRPELPDGLLPVFVLDRYEGLTARLLQDLTPAERERYVEANAAALRERCCPADLVFANHVLLGGPVGAASGAPLRREGARLGARVLDARQPGAVGVGAGVARARAAAVFVGSAHIRAVLEEVVGHVDARPRGAARRRRRRVPARSRATRRSRRCSRRRAATRRTRGTARSGCPDEGNAERLEAFFAADEPTVLYFGKLLYNKGVHLLFEALREHRGARADRRLRRLPRRARGAAPPRTLFTGPLEHRHLVHLLPLCDVAVVPSIFPEAFGMVAAEAAAAGCPPLVARHSGLAEVAEGLEEEYPRAPRATSRRSRPGDADELAAKLRALLALPRTSARALASRRPPARSSALELGERRRPAAQPSNRDRAWATSSG